MLARSITCFALAILCAREVQAEDNSGFRPLFNDKDTSGWHLRNPAGHNSWSVEDGILKNSAGGDVHGTDLVSDEKFRDFTVRYEYLVPDGSNSGFYLRGRQELQILGDNDQAARTKGCNGAIYAYKEPNEFVSKSGDQWQTAEATIRGNKITFTLNGVKVHDNVECNQATGGELDRELDQPGPIMLQGDHGTVWFRNIRIKELD